MGGWRGGAEESRRAAGGGEGRAQWGWAVAPALPRCPGRASLAAAAHVKVCLIIARGFKAWARGGPRGSQETAPGSG